MNDVPNFFNDVPRVPKCVPRWVSATNHLFMGLQIKLWTLSDKMRVLEATGRDVPNFTKDVPNFVKDVPRVQKCITRWGSTPNHFPMSSKMKLWTIHFHMGVLKAIGSDIPNFVKECTRFCECCTKGSKVCSEVGIDRQSLPYGFPNEIMDPT